MKTVSKNTTLGNKGKEVVPSERTLKLSSAEFDGIIRILKTPPVLSPKAEASWKAYQSYVTENPDANW